MRTNLSDAGIIEDQRADPVLLRNHTPGGERSCFGGCDRLHVLHAPEKHGPALIYHKQDTAFAFFRIDANMSLARPQSCFPINLANIITGKITAHFLEVEPATTQTRSMSTGEQGMNRLSREKTEIACRKFQLHQVFEGRVNTRNRLRVHCFVPQGTATSFKISSNALSVV